MGLEFIDELSVVDIIKSNSEVKNNDVCLVTYVHVCEKSMREFNKLAFAGETFTEAMVVGVEDVYASRWCMKLLTTMCAISLQQTHVSEIVR